MKTTNDMKPQIKIHFVFGTKTITSKTTKQVETNKQRTEYLQSLIKRKKLSVCPELWSVSSVQEIYDQPTRMWEEYWTLSKNNF